MQRPADGQRSIPPPMSARELQVVPEDEERWLANGLLPAAANVLNAAYPKSHKTNFLLEKAVALASATPVLGRFEVAERRRVGLVLFEGGRGRLKRRLDRIARAHGVTLGDLDGFLYVWYRPRLRLVDDRAMRDLGAYVADLGLEYFGIDNWSHVSTGNSNDSDEVTPQLDAFASLRDHNPDLVTELVHHARKSVQDRSGERLTDLIRNSSAFGAWYDVGFVLSRADEAAPVKIRAEFRDLPPVAPFAFTVEDEFPGNPSLGVLPSGALRLIAAERPPAALERDASARTYVPAVRDVLEHEPGLSKRKLRESLQGDNGLIERAFELLIEAGEAVYVAPTGRGKPGACYPRNGGVLNRAGTVLAAHPGVTVLEAATPPVRGEHSQHTPTAAGAQESSQHGSKDFDSYELEWERKQAAEAGR